MASAFAVFSLTPMAFESASAASDPTGIWMNDTGRGAIEIKHCGDALCGNVVWVKNAADAKGCGKQIIGNVAAVGGGRWDNGWIYSPERGRKYSVELTPLKNGTLRVTGYAGLKFLSKTMIWTRAPENLQLCNRPIDAKAGQPGSEPAAGATATAKTDAKSGANSTAATADAKPAANSKAPANPEVAIATPGPKILNPNAAPQTPPASASNSAAAAPPPADTTPEASKPQTATPSAPAQDAAKDHAPDDETASTDDNGGSDLEKKLDSLGLGKVFTKTKSGKCKIDLPWVKISVDCDE
jgi:uncharacterized protein (DUF2147 family)